MKYYVDAKRPDNKGDGLSWASSKRDIQAAIQLSQDDDEIVVRDGVYPSFSSERNKILIKSVNGYNVTVIDAHFKSRCASFISSDCILDGFTLLNGFSDKGGGVIGGTLQNCLITNCEVGLSGGGAHESVLIDCVLYRNFSYWQAGGASSSRLINCQVLENESRPDNEGDGGYAGGVRDCTLEKCVIKNNKAQIAGGAIDSDLTNCNISGNVSLKKPGPQCAGMYMKITNCVILEETIDSKYHPIVSYFDRHPFGTEMPVLTLLSNLPPSDRCVILETIRSKDPFNIEVYNKLSMAYLKNDQYDKAHLVLKEGFQLGVLDDFIFQELTEKIESMNARKKTGYSQSGLFTVVGADGKMPCPSQTYADALIKLQESQTFKGVFGNQFDEFYNLLIDLCGT